MPKCPRCHFQWVSTERSNPQLRYYFGVVLDMISDHLGYELLEVHELMITQFLKPLGKHSTIGLTTGEMVNHTYTVKRWASMELGLVIPDPPEVSKKGSSALEEL